MFSETDIYKADIPNVGEIHYDPLVLRRRLLAATRGRCWELAKAAKDFEAQVRQAGDGDSEAAIATRAEFSTHLAVVEEQLASAGMQAFGLTPIDADTGHGHTELAALRLLYTFLEWLEGKGERSGTWPTSSPTGESCPDRSPTTSTSAS